MGNETKQVFLFPLQNTVFFPTSTIPLTIFEPRYVQMVKDSLTTKTPIALAMHTEVSGSGPTDQSQYEDICIDLCAKQTICGVGIPIILEEHPDGTLLILLKGIGKYSVVEALEVPSYMKAKAIKLEENLTFKEGAEETFEKLKFFLNQWLEENVSNKDHLKAYQDNIQTPLAAIESFAMFMIFDPDIRQLILELNDINQKLDVAMKMLGQSGRVI